MSGTAHAKHFAPPEAAASGPRNLAGLGRAELEAEVRGLGEPGFRARQLWHWIYHQGARDFAAMTTLAKDFRAPLAEAYNLARP
ncbi:MAG: 23S rRNA (adenine(2503)-C(2))-methyltransferase RlmN, partial [Proteobacteria bacterium]|nr:23S rRNA (adenine(2503)-C(2))-methyltransferase RlmN [Pseudomonadota bacterium]